MKKNLLRNMVFKKKALALVSLLKDRRVTEITFLNTESRIVASDMEAIVGGGNVEVITRTHEDAGVPRSQLLQWIPPKGYVVYCLGHAIGTSDAKAYFLIRSCVGREAIFSTRYDGKTTRAIKDDPLPEIIIAELRKALSI